MVFDPKAKPYRDVLELIDESEPDQQKREALEEYFLDNNFEIRIAIDSEQPDLSELTAAITAVFLKPGERLSEVVPDYWREDFNGLDGGQAAFRTR